MGEIISIKANQPHLSGEARCVECGHKWIAVAPAGDVQLECPECESYKGIWIYAVSPENKDIFQCRCGCDIFTAMKDGILCYKCGITHSFGDSMS